MSRKLDAAIAEELGWKVFYGKHDGYDLLEDEVAHGYPPDEDQHGVTWEIPYFSEDGNTMLELDAEMRARGWSLKVFVLQNGEAQAIYFKKDHAISFGVGYADTMPKAVALAAYHALTGKDWQDD